MSLYLSPGVYTKERDISEIVANVASSSAALVGYSAKGDVDNIVLITNTQQFIDEYGEPDPTSGHFFHYAALAYLAKGNALYCLRVANGALYPGANIMKSTSDESNTAFAVGKSTSAFSAPTGYLEDIVFQIMSTNPGEWGNRTGIIIQNVKDGTEEVAVDQYTFEILVYWQDDDGNWSQVETWKVSRKEKIDGFGRDLYLEDKINGVSDYILVADSALADTILPKAQSTRLVLTGGSDGSDITDGQLITGWDEFINPSVVDIRLLINGGETSVAVQLKMKTVAEARLDCVALLDIPYSVTSSSTDTVTWRNSTQSFNSSYCVLDSPWLTIYDSYNDKLVEVPPSGYRAAQIAYNDYVGHPWDAPAGFNRGILDVQEIDPVYTEGERDLLHQNQINPFQDFGGEGNVIWGQLTEQKKHSALSDLNVRRLLIVLEKSIAISLRTFVFEPNIEITRFRVEALLNEYLDRIAAQGAFQQEAGDSGYRVICDETNNTPARIDNNELMVDVLIKPVRVAYYVQLQVTVTKSGTSFEELIAKGKLF